MTQNCCDRDGWILTLRLIFRLGLFIRSSKLRDWAQAAKMNAIELRHGYGVQGW